MIRNYGGNNNCTFCNAAKTRTITKTKARRIERTHFCDECFDDMEASNRRWALREEQERVDRGTIGSTGGRNIFDKGGAGQ